MRVDDLHEQSAFDVDDDIILGESLLPWHGRCTLTQVAAVADFFDTGLELESECSV